MEYDNNILLGFATITRELEQLFIGREFVFVNDKNGNVICTIYNNNEGRELLEKYLKDNHINRDDVNISVRDTLENKEIEEIFNSHKI